MKKLILVKLIVISISFSALAQEIEKIDPFPGFRQSIFIVPQYVAVSGIRIDYERKLKNGEDWLVVAPQLYSNNNGYDQFDSFSGLGLNAYYKMFLSHSRKLNKNETSRTNVYFATGPVFQYFNMKSIEEIPEEFVEEGVSYIRFNSQEHSTKIYRLGADANFGMQFIINRFSLDFYGGVGVRFALDENGETMDYFNSYWVDFGYTGILLTGGIRLGFLLQ